MSDDMRALIAKQSPHPPAEAKLIRMGKKPEKPLRTWRITLIRAKGQYIGRVEAPDAESAIKAAIEHFDIDEAHRSRLIAELVE